MAWAENILKVPSPFSSFDPKSILSKRWLYLPDNAQRKGDRHKTYTHNRKLNAGWEVESQALWPFALALA